MVTAVHPVEDRSPLHVVVDRGTGSGVENRRHRNRTGHTAVHQDARTTPHVVRASARKRGNHMPLTRHDAETASREITGRLMDAREKYSMKPSQSTAEELIHRQDDLIAALREQLRQALDNQAPPVITTIAGGDN